MAELKVTSPKPWATKPAGVAMMSCLSMPTNCSSISTVVELMTASTVASNSISGLSYSSSMISASNRFSRPLPAICMTSSTNAMNAAASC